MISQVLHRHPTSLGYVCSLKQRNSFLIRLADVLLDFVVPRICPGCSCRQMQGQTPVCATCLEQLARSNNSLYRYEERLYGTPIIVEQLYSAYLYTKRDTISRIVHSFKYRGNREVAFFMGQRIGTYWPFVDRGIDYLVPVPLHPRKKFDRGYNQSEVLAQGVSVVTGLPVVPDALVRVLPGSSQVGSSREQRLMAPNPFALGRINFPLNSHVLLVDDVLTTGSTLVSAIEKLSQLNVSKVSVLTLAVDM